jgi:uncharacterized protein YndB with AHSA1/START domain
MNTLKVEAHSDRQIVITRLFDAPRPLVFDAFTKPDLVRQWLLGPPGWSMPICEIDFRVGGRYRYLWRNETGAEMGMGGIYKEILAPERIVATEKFEQAWYPGEAVGTVVLTEKAGKTTLTQTILYDSRAARDIVISSPMEQGLAASYEQLEKLAASSEVPSAQK